MKEYDVNRKPQLVLWKKLNAFPCQSHMCVEKGVFLLMGFLSCDLSFWLVVWFLWECGKSI